MKDDPTITNDFEEGGRIHYLIASFIKGTLTGMERNDLDAWILQSEENEVLFDDLTCEENKQRTLELYESEEKVLKRIKQRIKFTRTKRKSVVPFSLISIAASLLIIISVAVFFLAQRGNKKAGVPETTVASTDPQPGKDRAILTLSDGRKIVLDSSAPSHLDEGRITVGEGTVAYNGTAEETSQQNTLATPRGGQYKLVLPDGTKVWLNAESSLTYTTNFTGNERRVSLSGEGYFEVTKNKEKPFIVESPAGVVKVLGTHFNINSYGDENLGITTLLEGSVELTKEGITKILKPGEQARAGDHKIQVETVDTKLAVAWKDGEFVFRNTPVTAIMRQLARWYDVQLEFKDPVEKHLNGTIKRDVPLSKVLHYLEETGELHFKVDGSKVIVLK
jgi:ferric-dicitrate binding protein FerR (iron transport regulator)